MRQFLDKKVPDEPFPRANAGGDEFDKNINAIIEAKAKIALQRIALLVTFNVAAISYFIMLRRGRVGPPRFDQLRGLVGNVLSRIRGQ